MATKTLRQTAIGVATASAVGCKEAAKTLTEPVPIVVISTEIFPTGPEAIFANISSCVTVLD